MEVAQRGNIRHVAAVQYWLGCRGVTGMTANAAAESRDQILTAGGLVGRARHCHVSYRVVVAGGQLPLGADIYEGGAGCDQGHDRGEEIPENAQDDHDLALRTLP